MLARQCAPAIVAAILLLSGTVADGQEARAVQLEGLRLGDALADLQRRGLKIIYSSEVVRPAMRVRTVPHVTSLRRLLDELVAEHGLIARDGPGGTVLVVKNPRARLEKSPTPWGKPARSPTASAPAAGDGVADHRYYEETVDVTDAAPHGVGRGPTPLVVPIEGARALAGGFENLFRAAQALPGVTSTDELGSRISVRGGSPDENLTVMDGIEIYYPFRLVVRSEDRAMVGLASTFNAETVQSATLSPGAFDVQYGDRLSSLLVVKHREGSDAERIEGAASLGVADANLVVEGRLLRQATGSWLVSARRSYLGLVAERVVGGALPSFQDVHARVSWYPRPRQRASLVALAGREHTRPGRFASADAATTTRTRNALVALTFESSVGSVGWSRTIVSRSQFSDVLGGSEQSFDNSRGTNTFDSIATGGLLAFQFLRDAAVRDMAVRQELAFTPSPRHQLDLGGEAHALDTRWAWRISGDRSQHDANGSSVQLGTGLPDVLDSSRSVQRVAGWLEDRWQMARRLTLQPGLRVDRSSLTGQSTLSPRVSLGFMAGRGWRLDAAFRRHSQTPGYEKTLQSDYFLDLSQPSPSPLKAERATHVVVSLQRAFQGGFSVRVDGYHKRFRDLLVGRIETSEDRAARLQGYDVPAALWPGVSTAAQITTTPENAASGEAYGGEALVSYTGQGAFAPLTGWAAYSLGRATRTVYGVTHPSDYDRRHGVSLAANVRIGPRFDLSATGRWATGLPRTPVKGVRLALVPDTHDGDGDGNVDELVPQRDLLGQPVFQPDLGDVSNLNSARSPRFARLDTRLTYRPSWSGERWAIYLDLVNVLNASNVVQIDSALVFQPSTDRPGIVELPGDRAIPFFPSFGIRFWF